MIVYKFWTKYRDPNQLEEIRFGRGWVTAKFEGWFLFGLIPLYIRQVSDWR